MRYAIPVEAPPSKLYRLAVRPLLPVIGGVFMGTLPSLAWMAANAFFLGCRDARKQLTIAVVGFLAIKLLGFTTSYLGAAGYLEAWFGRDGALVDDIASAATIIILFTILSIMSGRQTDLAVYQASVMGRRRLQWGVVPFVILIAANLYLVPLIDEQVPYFAQVWGKML